MVYDECCIEQLLNVRNTEVLHTKLPLITMSDVNELFKNNLEVKKKPRGYNSFVASNNNHTYQIGICFPQKFRGGLVATDVLSIYAVVVPIESKEIPDVIAGTMEALQKMGKKPQIIYTDDEGAVTSNDFRQYVEDEAKMAWWSERNVRGSKRKDCGGQKKKTAGQKERIAGVKIKGPWVRKKGLITECWGVKKEGLWVRKEGLGVRREGLWVRKEGLWVRKKGLWVRKEGLWVRKEGLWVRKEGLRGSEKKVCGSEKKGCRSEKKGCGGQKKRFVDQKRRIVGQKRRVVGQKRRVRGSEKEGL